MNIEQWNYIIVFLACWKDGHIGIVVIQFKLFVFWLALGDDDEISEYENDPLDLMIHPFRICQIRTTIF